MIWGAVSGSLSRPASTIRSRPRRATPTTSTPSRTRLPSAAASGRRYTSQRFDSFDELAGALGEFHARGIPTAAVQSHCAGDEIKFYGVGRGEFFHWFYSREADRHSFDESALKSLATRAAEAAGLEVYGGDIIVGADGELTLIDLNDWPSFAPCREAAADAIANLIAARAHAG